MNAEPTAIRGADMFTSTALAAAVATVALTVAAPPATAPRAAVQTPAAGKAAPAATAADVAPFLGDWGLALQGPNGPGAFDLSIRVDNDKPQADISSEKIPKQSIAELTMAEKTLALAYTFNYEGNPVNTMVRLTPAPDGTIKAEIDFADGAYVMTGTATKKEKGK
jgi:hypothetical protein